MGLIRVFKIPQPDSRYCFGGGKPMTFVEVDWFRDDPVAGVDTPTMTTEDGRQKIAEFVKGKQYYSDSEPFLVLSADATFTLNYNAP